ncbi:hypothetical protein [Kocuria sp. 2SI]|uniref:hypothetical protein n=1 Tax=Kocuria sp. 2SI TaxID=2502203 RepID=UPI001484D41A|nr:hypothetical protein [Kocuria sp. 2SI]
MAITAGLQDDGASAGSVQMPIPPRGGSSVVVPLRDAAVSVARRIPNWEGMIAEGPGRQTAAGAGAGTSDHQPLRIDHLRGDHRQLLGDRVHRGLGLGVEGRTVRDAGHQGSSFLAAASESRSHQPGMLRNRRMRQVAGNRSAMRAPWGA